MTAIVNFAFEEHLVRVIERDGDPWFVGKDVCQVLSIRNHNDALSKLDEDEKGVASTDPLAAGGSQQALIVSEPGVYRLVFRSRKPEAERFKRWLAHEVLPAIRRTGRYAPAGSGPAAPVADMDAPLDARVAAVRCAERLYGRVRARAVWSALGLPDVPEAPAAAETDPEACLAALLSAVHDGRMVGDLVAAGDDAALVGIGVRRGDGGLWIASAHPVMREIMAGWPRFFRTLAALPGAMVKTMKFGRLCSKAVFVPLP